MKRLFIAIAATLVMSFSNAAWAAPDQFECTITDAEMPLDALAAPNGRISIPKAVENGQMVDISKRATDAQSKIWLDVTTLDGHPIGWIAGKYVVCRQGY